MFFFVDNFIDLSVTIKVYVTNINNRVRMSFLSSNRFWERLSVLFHILCVCFACRAGFILCKPNIFLAFYLTSSLLSSLMLLSDIQSRDLFPCESDMILPDSTTLFHFLEEVGSPSLSHLVSPERNVNLLRAKAAASLFLACDVHFKIPLIERYLDINIVTDLMKAIISFPLQFVHLTF
jgi:hypothetical protein